MAKISHLAMYMGTFAVWSESAYIPKVVYLLKCFTPRKSRAVYSNTHDYDCTGVRDVLNILHC